ncbi:hypothetical protein M413DRAFT_12073 [Hebeloma cylindrosporum]|uniref:Uncharacterized protein n=1 Tax=Hebeloma cylindrosporum TaxID=76867 RepID=A0A0C3BRY0_HEBCY|nr:hypothetical protein M413DRAFT_12073 [Hebeloma cylindrosporum h7]
MSIWIPEPSEQTPVPQNVLVVLASGRQNEESIFPHVVISTDVMDEGKNPFEKRSQWVIGTILQSTASSIVSSRDIKHPVVRSTCSRWWMYDMHRRAIRAKLFPVGPLVTPRLHKKSDINESDDAVTEYFAFWFTGKTNCSALEPVK